MELSVSGLIVLALASLVTASPYGYVAKSGAVAKAEASASAGALPVIPLAIPGTPGFSGSFSKSSSSSFASSSASSSSSSSSFSYSGAGSNLVPGFGSSGSGCGGGCQHGLINSLGSADQGLHGNSGFQGHNNNHASASAIAGAETISNIPGSINNEVTGPCKGNTCHGPVDKKCSSGQCDGTGNADGNNAASSGTSQSESGNMFNDFDVNNTGKPQSTDTVQSSNKPFNNGQPQLTNMKSIFTSDTSDGKINNENIKSPDCESPDCGSFVHNKPYSHSESPYQEQACTTHDCKKDSTGSNPVTGKSPSSYNVPILGNQETETNTKDNPACISGKCQNDNDKNNYFSSVPQNVVTPSKTFQVPTGPNPNGVVSSDLNSSHQSSDFDVSFSNQPNLPISPNYKPTVPTGSSGFAINPSYQPSTVPDFGAHSNHHHSGSPSAIPNHSYNPLEHQSSGLNPNQPSSPISNPICTSNNCVNPGGQFSRPANPNQFNYDKFSTPSFPPSGASGPGYVGASSGSDAGSSLPVGSGSHFNLPSDVKGSNSKPLHQPSGPTSFYSKPSYQPSGLFGFHGTPAHANNPTFQPSGLTVNNANQHGQPVTFTGSDSKPSGTAGSYYTPSHAPSGPSGFSGPTGYDKYPTPQTSGASYDANYPDKPSSTDSNPNPNTNTGSYNKPSHYPSGSESFDSNIADKNKASAESNNNYQSSGLPSIVNGPSCTSGICENPSYNPSGPPSPGYNPSGSVSSPVCTSGNCGKPSYQQGNAISNVNALPYPSQTFSSNQGNKGGHPLSCTTPNCYSTPGTSPGYESNSKIKPTLSGSSIEVHSKPTKLDSEVLLSNKGNQIYTGGFGGPTGILSINSGSNSKNKPSVDGIFVKPSKTDGTANIPQPNTPNPNLNSPNYSNAPTASIGPLSSSNLHPVNTLKPYDDQGDSEEYKPRYTGGFGGPPGLLKPNEYTTAANTPKSPCSSGSCGPSQVNHIGSAGGFAVSDGGVVANAKSVAFSGSFGGPPGILKPHDVSKISKNGQDTSEKDATIESGQHVDNAVNSQPQHSNGVIGGSQASAVASASATATGYGQHSGGCNTGCPTGNVGHVVDHSSASGNSSSGVKDGVSVANASASAKSVAGASSFAQARSFASSSAHASAGASAKGGYAWR